MQQLRNNLEQTKAELRHHEITLARTLYSIEETKGKIRRLERKIKRHVAEHTAPSLPKDREGKPIRFGDKVNTSSPRIALLPSFSKLSISMDLFCWLLCSYTFYQYQSLALYQTF